MKRLFFVLAFASFTLLGFSQENLITVAGGYSFANFEDSDVKATGWRINGLYEFNENEGPWAYGVSIGYISLNAEQDVSTLDTADIKLSSLPIYFAPKFMFGNDKIKGFVKGAFGMHHTQFEVKSDWRTVEGSDWGLYAGLGAGAMYFVTDMIFIDIEYEFAWLSNSAYKDGLMNTFMGGVGFKF